MARIQTYDAFQLFEYPPFKANRNAYGLSAYSRVDIPPAIYPFTIAANPIEGREEAWFILTTPSGKCGEIARVFLKDASKSSVFGESEDGKEYTFYYEGGEIEFIMLPRAGGSRIMYWAQEKANRRNFSQGQYLARFSRGPNDKQGKYPSLLALQHNNCWYAASCATLYANEKNRIMMRRP